MRELEIAQKAAQAGGEVLTGYFRDGVVMRQKRDSVSYDLVSDADIESERKIVEVIRQTFPDHDVLGEESHDQNSPLDPARRQSAEHLWIIDPLDGTNNFAHQIPHFAVSIAYYQQGRPVCGVIHNPARDDWYLASRGVGAWHNEQRVQVGAQSDLHKVLVGVGFYYDRGKMMEATLSAIGDLFRRNIHGIRRFGTASLDLCQVGGGAFGAYFEYELSPWDFAAGRLYVEEAGGRVTTCHGAPLPLAKTSLLASNTILHEEMLSIVGAHYG